jgi:hypothetical protein
MKTIVMNTINGAVSEHALPFKSITANFAASDAGLFALGGDTDAGAVIDAELATPEVLVGGSGRTRTAMAYFSMEGAGQATVTVRSRGGNWPYPMTMRPRGVSRAVFGRGIWENYIGLAFANTAGADFSIDRIELLSHTGQRRL